MELSLVWLNLIHTLPILIITNLSNSSSVIVRAFQVHYLVPFSKDKWTKLLPPSQNKCLNFVKMWMYLDIKTYLDTSTFKTLILGRRE